MSIESKERKEKKKKEKTEPDIIPQNLEEISQTETKKQPPRPITLQSKKDGLPQPARLPPRFKNQLKKNLGSENIIPHSNKSENISEVIDKTEIEGKILNPVSIKKTRESIPAPRNIDTVQRPGVKPTRIKLEEPILEELHPEEKKKDHLNKSSFSPIVSQELILKQFDISNIINRPKESGWPWIKSKTINIPHELELYWKAEASMYSAIASLQFITNANEKGEIAPEVYGKQLKSHLMEAIQLRFKLEKDAKFTWDDFVSDNQIDEFFPQGLDKLARVTGSSDIDEAIEGETVKIDYQEIKKLPTKAADFVGNSIELMDIIRLQSIATVERLIPLLEDIKKILLSAKMFGENYWIIKEVDVWTSRLYNKEPGTIPEDEELERLEMHVVRWMNDFRRELKNL